MMYVIAFGALAVFVAIVWIFFVAPLGNQMHERKLEMIRRKLEQKQRDRTPSQDDPAETDHN